jgi:uncharacterized protein YdaU (DUF1376 family)
MNFYQHHIGDFLRDTARLSDGQCMAYLRLLWKYYEDEHPLVDDPEGLAFKIGADEQSVRQILRHFFFLKDGHWHQARADREIVAFLAKSNRAKQSVAARWSNAEKIRSNNDRNTTVIRPYNERIEKEQKTDTIEPFFDTTHNPLPSIKDNPNALTPDGAPSGERSDPVIRLPTNRFNTSGEEFLVTPEMLPDWEAAYPAVDIRLALAQARAWLNDNPTKRKTKTGMRKFLGGWFERRQNGGFNGQNQGRGQPVATLQPGQQAGRLTPAQRTAAKRESLRSQPPALGSLAEDVRDLRAPVVEPAGGRAE